MSEAILTRSGGGGSALSNLSLIAQPPKLTAFTANGIKTGASGWTGTGLLSDTTSTNASKIDCGGYLTKIDQGREMYLRPANSNDPAILFWTPVLPLYDSTTDTSPDVEFVWNPDRHTYIGISSQSQGASLVTNAAFKTECNSSLRWEFRPPAVVQYGVCNGLSLYYTRVNDTETFRFTTMSSAAFRNSVGTLTENLWQLVSQCSTGTLTTNQETCIEALTQFEQSIIAISIGVDDPVSKVADSNWMALENAEHGLYVNNTYAFHDVIAIDNL